jgi:hypothetical protein
MSTNVTRSQQATSNSAAHAIPAKEAATRADDSSPAGRRTNAPRKLTGYGLPCAKCHLYYPADLDVCPTCRHTERVSTVVPNTKPSVTQTTPNPTPDSAAVEKEREEFLRQFKSQLLEAHAEVAHAAGSVCKSGEHRSGELANAEVCQTCYARLQERLDTCEAALDLELTEASQIIYDAVWADPSDPGKTYQNAASALLTEVRKRAGLPVQGQSR